MPYADLDKLINHEIDMVPSSFLRVLSHAGGTCQQLLDAYQTWIGQNHDTLGDMSLSDKSDLNDAVLTKVIDSDIDMVNKIEQMTTRFGMDLSNSRHPLVVRAIHQSNPPVLNALLNAGADPNFHAYIHYIVKSFERTVSQNMVENLILLLDHGFDINHSGGIDGFTMLHYAAKSGHVEIVQILLECGAQINLKTKYYYGGDTALHLVAWNRDPESTEIIKMLLHGGVNVLAVDTSGRTALQILTHGGDSQYNTYMHPFSPNERYTNQLNIQLMMQRRTAVQSARHRRLGDRHDCHMGNVDAELLDEIFRMAENPSYRL